MKLIQALDSAHTKSVEQHRPIIVFSKEPDNHTCFIVGEQDDPNSLPEDAKDIDMMSEGWVVGD